MENLIFSSKETLDEFIQNNDDYLKEILELTDHNTSKETIIYALLQKLSSTLQDTEKLVKELQAPIIPSIVPDTILVPITGRLTEERLETIRTKILNNLDKVDTVIIDFTGIYKDDLTDIGIHTLPSHISQLNSSLHLMGVETLYVGFSPDVIKGIVNSGVEVNHLNCHLSFRTALQYLMDKKSIMFAPNSNN